MRVSLIKQNSIQGFILPNRVIGTYWITDLDHNENERNLISVEAHDGNWKIVSNNNVFCVQQGQQVPSVILSNYQFIELKQIEYENGKRKEQNLAVFISPTIEDYISYDINNMEMIKIGNSNSHINYNVQGFMNDYAVITSTNGNYILQPKGITYVNKQIVRTPIILNNGDTIFMMGLRMIFVIKNDQKMLFINNPLGKVQVVLNQLVDTSQIIGKQEVNDEDEVYMTLYSEEDYYHKNPRFETKIEDFEISIDSPPEPDRSKENPFLLTVAPMLMMSMTSVLSAYNAMVSLNNGKVTLMGALPSIIMAISMFASAIIWPTLTRRYQKREKKKYEEERHEKYSKYVEEKKQLIQHEIMVQRSKTIEKYPSTEVCQNTILNRMTRLWERRLGDDDFLTVNLGDGIRPMHIQIHYPQEHFSMAEDSLKQMVIDFGNEPKNLVDVPIDLSFKEKDKVAIVGKMENTIPFMKQLLLQLMTYHSYDDLRIVILTNKDNRYYWEFMKIVPYIWSNDRTFRFFGDNSDEYKEICYNLDAIFNQRNERKDNTLTAPHYLIVTDSFKSVRNFDFIKKLLKNEKKLGFSMVILNERITNLPEQCKTFVDVKNGSGELVVTAANNKPIPFAFNDKITYEYDKCAKVLANLPIEMNDEQNGELPSKLSFLEMYDVGKVEQLNSFNRWNQSNPILSLHAPVGVGTNGEKIELDLHENYHGPHGLIAGMTGSGKSEFIITYILSMAINYHPYEVQFILIDYKGGGLAGAFNNQNFRLPHLVGTITNLDANEINRSLASIESELKRRQTAFNRAREISGDSTIDVYKYQKLYRDGIVKEPISHLFIISDEFAELKVQQPEFMAQLIQTARIGRSLGVHLILATQKPSGVVDAQIWSNTRFRVCLRVQEQSDSSEVIKRQDAAYLKQTGRFYFQVGYNEIFVLGQAAWAGGKYIPSDHIIKNIDSDVDVVNHIGYVIKSNSPKKKNVNIASNGEEITNIVKYLDSLAKELNIKRTQLWLDRIPNDIYVNELIEKYHYQKKENDLSLVIGEYDDPSRQSQKLLTIPLSEEGNALIYGVAGSGKENAIHSCIYSSMLLYTPEEVNFYILDCGAGTLKAYSQVSIVGDAISTDNIEKVENLFKLLNTVIEERKKLFAQYNGDYISYLKISGKKLPAMIVVLNEFENFHELFEEYEENLIDFTRDAYKYGIYFIMTASTPNGVRFKLKQNFNQYFVLQQNNDDDYSNILGNVNKQYPSKNNGRGIVKWDQVYEFQIARICPEDKLQEFISKETSIYNQAHPNKALSIPTLPEVVSYRDIASSFGKDGNLIVGIRKDTLTVSEYDYKKNLVNLVLAQDIVQTYLLIQPMVNELLCLKEQIVVFNTEDYEFDSRYQKYLHYYDSKYEDGIEYLSQIVDQLYKKYVQNNYRLDTNLKHYTLVIIGTTNLFARISATARTKFETMLEQAKSLKVLDVIIFDNSNSIHRFELDKWYKNTVNSNDGIWIGNGVLEQYSIKIAKRTNDMKLDLPDNFAFVIRRGKAVLIKLLEKFDINLK